MKDQPDPDTAPRISDEIRKTTCYMCACRCGIDVHLKDGVPVYIDGNRDHPVNRGVLCAKGAAGLKQVLSPARLRAPLRRTGPRGSGEFREISWDEAIEGIARHMKDDRDANFIERNMDGVPVNRWTTTGFLAASATTNETAFLTYKAVRSTGIVAFDNQARV